MLCNPVEVTLCIVTLRHTYITQLMLCCVCAQVSLETLVLIHVVLVGTVWLDSYVSCEGALRNDAEVIVFSGLCPSYLTQAGVLLLAALSWFQSRHMIWAYCLASAKTQV